MRAPNSTPITPSGCPTFNRTAFGVQAIYWRGCIGMICILLGISTNSQVTAADEKPEPPSRQLEALVTQAFEATFDGWSVDEVLLHDQRRREFLNSCEKLGLSEHLEGNSAEQADRFCRALLHVRKRGGQLPKATRRAPSASKDPKHDLETITTIAEIAARRLSDEVGLHTDALLVNSRARARFDELAESALPGCSTYLVRKAALKLRKTRRLEPELLSRVTDWKKRIVDFPIDELTQKPDAIPNRPGIYVFRDETGYLYIGQASNLRQRLEKHLIESDRKALAQYLTEADEATIVVELHIFEKDSPGEDLRIRRAYESELIRTREPKLNVAP